MWELGDQATRHRHQCHRGFVPSSDEVSKTSINTGDCFRPCSFDCKVGIVCFRVTEQAVLEMQFQEMEALVG